MDDEPGEAEGDAGLHPLYSPAGRRMLRDLQDVASAAEWHEVVARIFRYLFVCAGEGRSVTDPRLALWMERIAAAVAAGPPGGKRRAGVVQARRDADWIRANFGPRPARADAVNLLTHDEMQGRRGGLADTALALRRARDNAAKRVDAAARVGLVISRRPKRK